MQDDSNQGVQQPAVTPEPAEENPGVSTPPATPVDDQGGVSTPPVTPTEGGADEHHDPMGGGNATGGM